MQYLDDLQVGLALRLDAIQQDLDAIKAWLGGQPPLDPEFVAGRLGLTPAEGRVAAALAEGKTPHGIAEAMGLKVTTVRWFLKMINGKLGTKTQAQLVRRVLLLDARGAAPPTDETNPKRTS